MAFSATARNPGTMADINVTPLVDVMLVLLIIFMVTAPLLSREIRLDLPQRGPEPPAPPGEVVRLTLDAAGMIRLDGRVIPPALLAGSLQLEAARTPQPLLQIDSAADAPYQHFAAVLATARNSGLERVALVAAE